MSTQIELLTRKDVMGAAKISSETLRRVTRAGELTALRIGRRGVRYRAQDVLAWLLRGQRHANQVGAEAGAESAGAGPGFE